MEDSAEGFPADVAANVLAVMEQKPISQNRLAHAMGISPQTLGRRLRGEYPFTTNELGVISRALGVPVETLVARPRPQQVTA